jgi:hypothetical protein
MKIIVYKILWTSTKILQIPMVLLQKYYRASRRFVWACVTTVLGNHRVFLCFLEHRRSHTLGVICLPHHTSDSVIRTTGLRLGFLGLTGHEYEPGTPAHTALSPETGHGIRRPLLFFFFFFFFFNFFFFNFFFHPLVYPLFFQQQTTSRIPRRHQTA